MDPLPKLRIRSPNMVKPQLPIQRPDLLVQKTKTNLWDNEEFVLGVIVGILGIIIFELFFLLIYGLFGAVVSLI
jgi:hypothetical protein